MSHTVSLSLAHSTGEQLQLIAGAMESQRNGEHIVTLLFVADGGLLA